MLMRSMNEAIWKNEDKPHQPPEDLAHDDIVGCQGRWHGDAGGGLHLLSPWSDVLPVR
jgi:hypothetical protein